MNFPEILAMVWDAMNAPAAIAFVAGVFLWLLNRLYTAKPEWQKYEGAIITAIKFAEKNIPDDSPNAGLSRLDDALKYVVKVYEEANGKKATPDVVASLVEGIQLTHNKLEAMGTLKGNGDGA